MCSSRALSRLRVLFRVGVWCSDPGAHVLSFGVVSGFGHSSHCVSVRSLVCVLVSCWSVVFGSPHSCLEFRFRVGVRTLVSLCERALSRLRVLFRVGAWSSDPGAHVLSFGFVLGFRHSSLCVSVRSRVRSTWTRVGVSIGCVYSCYILCCVGRSLCIHWLSAFMLSCLV